jgi:hypothetical protein
MQAAHGAEIILATAGKLMVELRSYLPATVLRLGGMIKGRISMSPDRWPDSEDEITTAIINSVSATGPLRPPPFNLSVP